MSSDSFNSFRIHIFKNGEEHYEGKRFVVNHRNYRNWEQFLADVSKSALKAGAVRKLFTANGTEIMTINELRDLQQYVASSGEAFINCNYSAERKRRGTIEETTEKAEKKDEDQQIFSPDSKGIRVYAYLEGKQLDEPKRLVLNYRNCKSFDQCLSFLSAELKANEGPIRLVFDTKNHVELTNLNDFYDGVNIIAIANTNLLKPRSGIEYPVIKNDKILDSDRLVNEKLQIVQQVKLVKSQIKKENVFEFGGKSINVFAHLSGFDANPAAKIVLNWRNCKNMEQFINILSTTLRPREGPVRSVFQMDLKNEILDLSTLYDNINVVCVAKHSEKVPRPGNYQLQSSSSTISRPSSANVIYN